MVIHLGTTIFMSTLGMLECMKKLSIRIKCREGPLSIVADTLSPHPQSEQLFLSDKDAALCTKYLKCIAPQFMLKQCINTAVTVL